jgi:hypothetical protein
VIAQQVVDTLIVNFKEADCYPTVSFTSLLLENELKGSW